MQKQANECMFSSTANVNIRGWEDGEPVGGANYPVGCH